MNRTNSQNVHGILQVEFSRRQYNRHVIPNTDDIPLSEYENLEVLVQYSDGSIDVLSFEDEESLTEGLEQLSQSDEVAWIQPNYSYEAFKAGVAALRKFCILRAESSQSQLDGIIPSTDEGPSADITSLIDASALNLSDMGSMNMGGMGLEWVEIEAAGRTVLLRNSWTRITLRSRSASSRIC